MNQPRRIPGRARLQSSRQRTRRTERGRAREACRELEAARRDGGHGAPWGFQAEEAHPRPAPFATTPEPPWSARGFGKTGGTRNEPRPWRRWRRLAALAEWDARLARV